MSTTSLHRIDHGGPFLHHVGPLLRILRLVSDFPPSPNTGWRKGLTGSPARREFLKPSRQVSCATPCATKDK